MNILLAQFLGYDIIALGIIFIIGLFIETAAKDYKINNFFSKIYVILFILFFILIIVLLILSYLLITNGFEQLNK